MQDKFRIKLRMTYHPTKIQKDLIFIYRIDKSNSGDLNCCPRDYINFNNSKCYDINNVPDTTNKIVILGGGGIFHKQSWDRAIKTIIKKSYCSVLWGAGSNYHNITNTVLPKYIDRFDMVGLRDWGTKYRWVPCVSCMNKGFDIDRKIKNDVVVYEHKDHRLCIAGLPCMNNRSSMREALDFLGSAQTVITNTYHGVYWSLLLSKKVVILRPFSSRFYGLKYNVPMFNNYNEWDGTVAHHIGVLYDSRMANLSFYKDVSKLL